MAQDTAASGITAALAQQVHALALADVPERARHAARRALVNIVGCCVGGARHAIVETAARTLMPYGGRPTSGLLGRPEKTDALTASLLNALSSAAYSFDDTHAETILHPTGVVVAALLAHAGHTPMRGDDFLLALTLGVDVASRISKAVSVAPAQGPIGWSQTGIAAGIGAVAAMAKVLQMDATQTGWAIGHAVQQASGLRVAHGTMSATLIFGNAAQSGLRSALLAQQGLSGPDAPLEGRYGFGELFASVPHLAHLSGAPGEHFEVEALAYKPYPCGIVIHATLDACLQLHRQAGPGAQPVAVTLRVNPLALKLTGVRRPRTPLESHVSLFHWAAASLLRGSAGLPETQPDCIEDPQVATLRERVEAIADAQVGREQAIVDVTYADGRSLRAQVLEARGSRGRPMTDDELDAKFRAQALPVLMTEAVDELQTRCRGLASLADAGQELGAPLQRRRGP
jgi:2-methylcitrate dehydratase PrpD